MRIGRKKKQEKAEKIQTIPISTEQTNFINAWMRWVRESDKLTKYLQGADENDLYDIQEILGYLIRKADENIKTKNTDFTTGLGE